MSIWNIVHCVEETLPLWILLPVEGEDVNDALQMWLQATLLVYLDRLLHLTLLTRQRSERSGKTFEWCVWVITPQ